MICRWVALNWTSGDRVATLSMFVAHWFDPPGSDLLPWTPPDWTADPPFLDDLADNATIYEFGRALNGIWPVLGRVETPNVSLHPERHTLLQTPHQQIVPGGRFREFYYCEN